MSAGSKRNQQKLNKAFLKAAGKGDLAMLRVMLDRGADLHAVDRFVQGAFRHAIWGGHSCTVCFLLEQEGAAEQANAAGFNGWTSLHDAAGSRHADILELLLARGALLSLNATNDWGDTPLMKAAYFARTENVCVLLRAGADVSIKNEFGNTARDEAIHHELPLVVAKLDEFAVLVGGKLPALALTLEGLEGLKGIFIPREIINLFLFASFQICF